jgi:predicted nucleic acid-binding protein
MVTDSDLWIATAVLETSLRLATHEHHELSAVPGLWAQRLV